MPAFSPITIKDRASTPANHTFTPQGRNGDIATWTEKDGVPFGDQRFSTGTIYNPSTKRYKVVQKFVLPVVVTETIGGSTVSRVARTAYAEVVFHFDNSSTEQERKDAKAFVSNINAPDQPVTEGTVVALEGVYA